LGVHVGVDALEVPKFLELLNLFAEAVTGHGYAGLREELIARLLREGSGREMKFDTALAILAQEFEQYHTDLSMARQALKDFPEELADAIKKATRYTRATPSGGCASLTDRLQRGGSHPRWCVGGWLRNPGPHARTCGPTFILPLTQ
jgi:hypothetical protein